MICGRSEIQKEGRTHSSRCSTLASRWSGERPTPKVELGDMSRSGIASISSAMSAGRRQIEREGEGSRIESGSRYRSEMRGSEFELLSVKQTEPVAGAAKCAKMGNLKTTQTQRREPHAMGWCFSSWGWGKGRRKGEEPSKGNETGG